MAVFSPQPLRADTGDILTAVLYPANSPEYGRTSSR